MEMRERTVKNRIQMGREKEGISMRLSVVNAGSVIAAFLASACCIVPLIFSVLGLGGVAFAATLEPYRPYFIGLTVVFLGIGFYYAYRPGKEACGPDGTCEIPRSRKLQRLALWIVTLLTAILVAFPYLLPYLY